jgi:hypothetical protein
LDGIIDETIINMQDPAMQADILLRHKQLLQAYAVEFLLALEDFPVDRPVKGLIVQK